MCGCWSADGREWSVKRAQVLSVCVSAVLCVRVCVCACERESVCVCCVSSGVNMSIDVGNDDVW